MAALNARLKQPEQVRRWKVLPYDLTVEGGELTTSLRLRRAVVAERLGDVIASLYDQAPAPAGRSRR
jgi:long-chain acyl-CoA synthetase